MEERRLGQEIRRLRKERRLSQTELAEKADVALMTISRIERGEHDPHIRTLGRITRALGVSPFHLLRSAGYFGGEGASSER
jgi:transcriptional regulator with XRE-family HTH domain